MKGFIRSVVSALILMLMAFSVNAQIDYTAGTGTQVNGGTTFPNPVQDYWEGSRMQYLFRASELTALGMSNGTISAVKFNITALNTFSGDIEGYSIKIGSTSDMSLSATGWVSGVTPVFGPVAYTPTLGVNTFTFSTPFQWDGVSNIVLEICNGGPLATGGITYTNNPSVAFTSGLGFFAHRAYYADENAANCAYTGTTQSGTLADSSSRPNTTFSFTPGTACTGTPVAGQATSSASNVCNGVPFTLGVSGQTLASGIKYRWQISTNNSTWTYIDTARLSPSYSLTQTANNYYRAEVTCGANSAFTSSVLVTTPSLIAANTYTINATAPASATNFTSIGAAVDFIRCGVNGNVIFNVVANSGPYTENVVIPQIGGNQNARITFNGNGNTLNVPVSASGPSIAFLLNGADRITIDSFNIDLSALASNATGIWLTGRADSNILRRNTITLSTSSTNSTLNGIIASGSTTSVFTTGNNANFNTVENNNIIGGYYGLWLYGNGSAPFNTGNRILNNRIYDQYIYFTYLYGQTGALVSKNDHYRSSRTAVTTTYGLYMNTCDSSLVERNTVRDMFVGAPASTSAFYGIYSFSNTTTAAKPLRYINNGVYNNLHNGLSYQLYHTGGSHTTFYHNTISSDNSNGTATAAIYGFYSTPTTALVNVAFRNNIVYINRGGTGVKGCIFLGSNTVVTNNNVLFNASTGGNQNFIGFQGTGYATLDAWKLASFAPDAASIGNDPLLQNIANGDLTPGEPLVNGIGAALGVNNDINGKARSNNPDPGAVEIDLPPCNGTPQAGQAVSSASTVCANTNFSLSLQGATTGSNVRYQWQTAPSASGPWTNLDTAQLGTVYQTQQSGTLYYRAQVSCGANTVTTAAILVTSPALVNGILTVNPSQAPTATNFTTIQEAVNAIQCGVNGPVTINVAPNSGPYNEQVTINAINGTNNARRITINGNGNTIATLITSTTGNRAAFLLNGADFVTIDSFVIEQIGTSTVGFGVVLTARADSNIIRRNVINQNLTSTSTAFSGIVLSSSLTSSTSTGDNGNGNIIERNTINGGYYGVTIAGVNAAGGPLTTGNIVRNNKLLDQYFSGLYTIGAAGTRFLSNDISRPTRTNTAFSYYPIYLSSGYRILVDKNRIHNCFDAMASNTGTFYALYSFASGTADSTRNIISNNAIYRIGHLGPQYGFYCTNYAFNSYLHNTVVLEEAASANVTNAAYYAYGASNIFRNNLAYIDRPGTGLKYGFYFGTTAPQISNNNLVFITPNGGTYNPYYLTSGFTSLSAFQASNAQAFEQNSLDLNPFFDANLASASVPDFIPTNSTVNNKGFAAGILTDIRDSIRSATTPDIGAFEFNTNTAGTNLSAIMVVAPGNRVGGCYPNSNMVTIRIINLSTQTHNFATNPATVSLLVTGAKTTTLTTVVNSGTLSTDSVLDISLSTPLIMDVNGAYNLRGMVKVTSDNFPANDTSVTAIRTKQPLAVGSISNSSRNICFSGTTTLRASGVTGYESFRWQSSATLNGIYTDIPGAADTVYTTSNITQTTYFRGIAACNGASVPGTTDSSIVNTPSLASTTGDSVCVSGAMTLKSTVQPNAIGSVWYSAPTGGAPLVQTLNYTTPVLNSSTTYYVAATSGTTQGVLGLTTPSSTTPNSGYNNLGLVFNAIQPFTIQTVDVYPFAMAAGATGTVTIALVNSAGTILATTGALPVNAGPSPGVLNVVPLNFAVPVGNDHRLLVTAATGITGLRRESTTGFTYPYTLAGVGSITSGFTGGVPNASFYYYLYNWQISVGCESPRTGVLARVRPATEAGCATTPVSYSHFTGHAQGSYNLLNWGTVNEIDNAGFKLERSADGQVFEPIAAIASKAPGGTSAQPLKYDYLDKAPLRGDNFYRLLQTDFNGRKQYSTVVRITGSGNQGIEITRLYPNPARQITNLQFTSVSNSPVQILVTDMAGRVVLQKPVSAVSGLNNVVLTTAPLVSGTYLVKLVCANGCESTVTRLIKE